MISKPICFLDLLELQRILDKEIAKSRNNGFIPRKRDELDILLAIDDEFQEWLRELPQEYNFKTWKQKEYSREKELEELTDVLFFFLQYANNFFVDFNEYKIDYYKKFFSDYGESYRNRDLMSCIRDFKCDLWSRNDMTVFLDYISICKNRGFTKEDLLNTYWKKWQKNMTRINKDWILEGKNEK